MRKKLREPFLNGEQIYKYYFSMGEAASVARLTRWAISSGMAKPARKTKMNPEGLPRMGVWKAMWRWASLKENRNDAYLIFAEFVKTYGWTGDTDFPWPKGTEISLSDWHRFMLPKIQTAWQFQYNRHNRFLLENGWS